MIISTNNERIRKILAGLCLLMPDGRGYNTASVTISQLANLCTVLVQQDFAGQWSVSFTEPIIGQSYDELTSALDERAAQAFVLAPGAVGADSDDLIYFVEEVYGQPVTPQNWQRVLQFFRFWYANTRPEEYCQPPGYPPAKFAELDLYDTQGKRTERKRRRDADLQAKFAEKGWDSPSAALTAMKNGKVEIPQNPKKEGDDD